jgi:hypothetical protein
VIVVKLAQAAANVAAATAVLWATWSLVTGAGSNRFNVACSLVTSLCIGAMFVMQRRADRSERQRGRWDEQSYVTTSLGEAMDRGMTAKEWTDGYLERVMADLTR